ncbi:MAG TPA: 50S ribosomal protein L30 [Candidatus Binataceae bacterium]
MADKIKLKLVHSPIGTKQRVRETVKGLGLRKLGSISELTRTPEIEGMVKRVAHLVAEVKD